LNEILRTFMVSKELSFDVKGQQSPISENARHRSKILNNARSQVSSLGRTRKNFCNETFCDFLPKGVRGWFKNLKKYKGSNKKSWKELSNEILIRPPRPSALFIKNVRIFSSFALNATHQQHC